MTLRIIARLDIKPPNLVKGIHLEGFRKLGIPSKAAHLYYEQGVDELIYQDVVASLYNRNSITELVSETAEGVFIPLTVGGGIRSVVDATNLVRSGADKISINTQAIKEPEIINDIARELGTQAVVLCIEAKKIDTDNWLVMTDSGREHTGLTVSEWLKQCNNHNYGELLLTSIDKDGTKNGFDLDLVRHVRKLVDVPLIAHGGCGSIQDVIEVQKLGVDGVALATAMHYGLFTIHELKSRLVEVGIEVRS